MLKDRIHILKKHQHYHTLYTEIRRIYNDTKLSTVHFYHSPKLIHAMNARYQKHSAQTQEMLTQQTLQNNKIYHLTLQWMNRETITTAALNQQQLLYDVETCPIHRRLYFHKKRPREEEQPTVWEVPLQPLPKQPQTHAKHHNKRPREEESPTLWEVPLQPLPKLPKTN